MDIFILVFVFVFGLIIGSFLNVCIFRIPAGQSIAWPASHCPKCKSAIKWYDNIPVLSFLLLGAKCRACREKISWQYPAVEFFTAAVSVLFVWHLGYTWWAPVALVAVYSLIILSVIDIRLMIIPDRFSLGMIVWGLAFCFLNPLFEGGYWSALLQSFTGGCVGFFGFWAIAIFGKIMFKKDAMGGGDIKLMGGAGTLIGYQGVLCTLFIASVFGFVYAMYLMLRKKANGDSAIPFGPFLSLGILINLYYPVYEFYIAYFLK